MNPSGKFAAELSQRIARRRLRGLFITGTDTAVGKTHVTAGLVRRLRRVGIDAVAVKPVACGDCGRRDARIYWNLARRKIPLGTVNPYWFRRPLAPVAQKSKLRISASKIRALVRRLRTRHDVVLVEGAGGLLVPLDWKRTVRDLACSLRLPLLIVARAGLGTLNHTILTVESARRARLKIEAIVLNDPSGRRGRAARGNRRVLRRLTGLPVYIWGRDPVKPIVRRTRK